MAGWYHKNGELKLSSKHTKKYQDTSAPDIAFILLRQTNPFFILRFITVSKPHRHCIGNERLRISADCNPLLASPPRNGIFITLKDRCGKR